MVMKISKTDTMKEPIYSLPLADFIDVILFGEEIIDGKKTSIVLYAKKHKVEEISNNLSVILTQEPTEVGGGSLF